MYFIEQSADILALFLLVVVLLSVFARWHWCFSLLTQFTPQYFYGGLILAVAHLCFGNVVSAALLVGIAGFIFIKIQKPRYKAPRPSGTLPNFTFSMYNKYCFNQRYDEIYSTLKNADVVLIVEALQEDEAPLKNAFKNTHPYFLPKGVRRPDFIFPISKYKIESLAYKALASDICFTKGMRFCVQPDGMDVPITIYTLHTEIPITKHKSAIQKAEMAAMAEWIKHDVAENGWKNVIFAGDWNTTPYAPVYQDMLAVTGLKNQSFGIIPTGSWPSFLYLPILKIPIDHILFMGDLVLCNFKKSNANGSDHHSLIAQFCMKP
ncbi:MAG: endonuclease/exonuclease/phosphatase family protein [Alphaproteobacteria bacterium]